MHVPIIYTSERFFIYMKLSTLLEEELNFQKGVSQLQLYKLTCKLYVIDDKALSHITIDRCPVGSMSLYVCKTGRL